MAMMIAKVCYTVCSKLMLSHLSKISEQLTKRIDVDLLAQKNALLIIEKWKLIVKSHSQQTMLSNI